MLPGVTGPGATLAVQKFVQIVFNTKKPMTHIKAQREVIMLLPYIGAKLRGGPGGASPFGSAMVGGGHAHPGVLLRNERSCMLFGT